LTGHIQILQKHNQSGDSTKVRMTEAAVSDEMPVAGLVANRPLAPG
jgi:hypothetical protein